MSVFVISDMHLWHENILKWGREQFPTVQDMNNHIRDKWNSVVTPEDKVYVLGDCFFGGRSDEEYKGFFDSLLGKKRLVVGNHDNIPRIVGMNIFGKISLWRQFHEENLLLTHVPVHQDALKERMGEKSINVHGHTHLRGSPDGPYVSVCCELVDYTPVNIKDIRKRHV